MFFFDPPVYALLNANAQTWPASIETARLASAWLPNLGIGAVLLAFWRSTPALRRTLVMLLLSMAFAWCVSRLIRWGFPMPRPAQLGMGMQWIHHGASASFPSMHAGGAFALAQAVSLGCTRHRRPLVWLAWACALLIAWSRVHLGVHFPSDVLGGALVGSGSALAVWQLYYRLRRLLRSLRQPR
ncbi:undecaprenyl-diphosphatase [Comamonas phosphati]|nr:undecaprenyl-diphosphatase [Comamonas phosphati]